LGGGTAQQLARARAAGQPRTPEEELQRRVYRLLSGALSNGRLELELDKLVSRQQDLQQKVCRLISGALWNGRLEQELAKLKSQQQEKQKWISDLQDGDPEEQPTKMLQDFKALPTRDCRKEPVAGLGEEVRAADEAIEDDVESNLESNLDNSLMVAASVCQQHYFRLQGKCSDAAEAWCQDATLAFEDFCARVA